MQLLTHTAPSASITRRNRERTKRPKDVRRREEGSTRRKSDDEKCEKYTFTSTSNSLQRIEAEKERQRQHQLDLQRYKETYVGPEDLIEPLPTVMQVEIHGDPFGPERVGFSRIFVYKSIFIVI